MKENKQATLTNSTYNILKNLVTIVLPAFSSLYFGLSSIWAWPDSDKVTGSIALLITFLGVVLKVSSNRYNNLPETYDGDMEVEVDEGGIKTYNLVLYGDPEELQYKDKITFRVRS